MSYSLDHHKYDYNGTHCLSENPAVFFVYGLKRKNLSARALCLSQCPRRAMLRFIESLTRESKIEEVLVPPPSRFDTLSLRDYTQTS